MQGAALAGVGVKLTDAAHAHATSKTIRPIINAPNKIL
jgi:hypothetical protein